MNISELVQLADSHEHLCRIKPRVLLLEDPRVVQQGPEISTGNVFLTITPIHISACANSDRGTISTHHGEINMIPILKRVKQADQPGRLGRRQDVPLDQDVLDLVHLGQRRLFHLFQRADFARIGLAGEEDGSVASLSDLPSTISQTISPGQRLSGYGKRGLA